MIQVALIRGHITAHVRNGCGTNLGFADDIADAISG
jgi:hypothetical protein